MTLTGPRETQPQSYHSIKWHCKGLTALWDFLLHQRLPAPAHFEITSSSPTCNIYSFLSSYDPPLLPSNSAKLWQVICRFLNPSPSLHSFLQSSVSVWCKIKPSTFFFSQKARSSLTIFFDNFL